MTRLADGDRSAFEPVFTAALPLVRDLARRMLGSSEVDDAAQEALIKVFSRAADYDPERDALTWIMTIAGYECRTIRKRRQRRGEVPIDHAPETATGTPEDLALNRELCAAMRDALGSLSPVDAATIRAVLDERRAGPHGVAATALRKRLQRALGRLRAAWQERHEHGE